MNYSMKTPCDGCPFLKGHGAIRLDKGRAKAIAEMMVQPQGGTFPCHKTTAFDDDGDHVARREEVHCAGALIFAEKNGVGTQMMRIAERLGIYDARALMTDNPAVKDVFDSVKEMVKANDAPYVSRETGKKVLAACGRKAKKKTGRA